MARTGEATIDQRPNEGEEGEGEGDGEEQPEAVDLSKMHDRRLVIVTDLGIVVGTSEPAGPIRHGQM